MKLPNVAVISRCTIKSDTNAEDKCKQYFKLLISEDKPEEVALMIKKYVLTDNKELYLDFEPLRTFRGKTLHMQIFSIRIGTLEKAWNLLLERAQSK